MVTRFYYCPTILRVGAATSTNIDRKNQAASLMILIVLGGFNDVQHISR